MSKLTEALIQFTQQENFKSKGPLCVALVITRYAIEHSLPLNSEVLITEGKGQVLGLGKSKVQSILSEYGIERVLAQEGGRTSRGSISNMQNYVKLLNELFSSGLLTTDALRDVEIYWIAQVKQYFSGKPFNINLDASISLKSIIKDLIGQALKRQQDNPYLQYVGAMLQHLTGAKLECALPEVKLSHHSFSTSDEQSLRPGDFYINDVAIHVTTSPSEALMHKCLANINQNIKPVIVTLTSKVPVAEGLADNLGFKERLDVFDIEQFLALNIHELGAFSRSGHRQAISDIIERYNAIIDNFETDPSLKIKLT